MFDSGNDRGRAHRQREGRGRYKFMNLRSKEYGSLCSHHGGDESTNS